MDAILEHKGGYHEMIAQYFIILGIREQRVITRVEHLTLLLIRLAFDEAAKTENLV